MIFVEIDVGLSRAVALDAAHHEQAAWRVDVMLPFGDGAFGFDFEEQSITGVYKVRLTIDGDAGLAQRRLAVFLALVLRATVNFYRSSEYIMSLTIQDANAEQLARRLADATGESIPQAVTRALEERWQKLQPVPTSEVRAEQILGIAKRAGALPELDRRSADAILGYAEDGTLQ